MPASDFSFKASKESSLDRFSAWMKAKYSEPRQPGQRGASKIKEGKNPKTWIPNQIDLIINTGKLSVEFSAEIESFNEDEKYSGISQDDITRAFKKKNPQKFAEFEAMMNEAKELAYKELLQREI
jgi:hypothetical protein